MSAPTDYDDLLEGLHECFLTLNDFDRVQLLKEQPKTVHTSPLLYSVLETVQYEEEMQLQVERFTTLHRVVIQWQEPETAEKLLRRLVTDLPYTVEQDFRLGGRITRGGAIVNFVRPGFVYVAKIPFRSLDFKSLIVNKRARYR